MNMRALGHYVVTAIVIPIYGIQVCPFIETLSPVQVTLPIVLALAVQFFVRERLYALWVMPAPLKRRVRKVFGLEATLFFITAIFVMGYNELIYGFPFFESGLKVLVGIFGLGLFAATDVALAEERLVADIVERDNITLAPDADYFPLTQKIAIFATVALCVMAGVFMLLVVKDLDWIVNNASEIGLREAQISVLKEFAFVLIVVLPHTINIIRAYTTNLKRILSNQTHVLTHVTQGEYNIRVPVASNDEFGVIAQHTNTMVDRIESHVEELGRTRDVTILSLATLAETRDNETGAHILRTQRYVRALAQYLRTQPKFTAALSDETIDLLFKSAPLHDVGKVGIPDAILLKPGKLTDDEFVIMKTHAQLGADALRVAEKGLGTNNFLRYAREIAATHHEKFDGSGYPNGLQGDAIPLAGRLMAVADVYDALISKRVYKPAFSHDKAIGIIRDGCATHFDPDIVDALNAVEHEFIAIAKQYGDKDHDAAAE